MRKSAVAIAKVLIVPILLTLFILTSFLLWIFYYYGGIRYGLDRLNGSIIVPLKPVIDLGKVEPGTTVTATFQLLQLFS
jgi:hypothetical protein